MKYILLVLALLALSACDSSNNVDAARAQYQAASANLSAAIAQQAAIDKATVQAKMAATEVVMATQGAQDAAVKQLQIEASATMSAIDIRAQQDDLLNRQALATRIANDYNLQATAQIQQAQATSTAIYLDMAARSAKVQRVQATADFWSGFLPALGGIILVAITLLFCVLVWYAGKRAKADADRREEENRRAQYSNRYYNSPNGGTFYLPPGGGYPILINTLNRIWELPAANYRNDEQIVDDQPETSENQVDRSGGQFVAGLLIRWSAKSNGWESQDLLGYRDVPDFSGRKWTKAIDYIRSVGVEVETTTGDGSHLTRDNLQQAYARIYSSPIPTGSNGNGHAEQ